MADETFVQFVLDQLSEIAGLRARRMFGGHGLYAHERFFAIIFRGRLYFKTDERSRADYLAAGMTCLTPSEKQSLVNYYEVPAAILEDQDAITVWARRAIEIA